MTPPEYEVMLAAQEGKCAGCGKPTPLLHIDHSHECPHHKPTQSCTACRRGLLCPGCNQALGMVADSASTLRQLADYLDAGGTR